MAVRKTSRVRKARTIWEQKGAPSTAKDPKITKKTAHTRNKTALKPIATGSLLKTVDFDADHLSELLTHKPPLNLEFKASNHLLRALRSFIPFKSSSRQLLLT